MELPSRAHRYARLVAWVVTVYGLATMASALLHELEVREHHTPNELFLTLPVVIGMSYLYLGALLFRLKYNAWLTAVVLSAVTVLLNGLAFIDRHLDQTLVHPVESGLRVAVPLLLLLLLYASQDVFRVRSDRRGFRLAIRTSAVVLLVTFAYGVAGFMLLDTHDFHQEISLPTAAHQTIDQLGVTTPKVVPRTARAHLFMDSLSVISAGAVAYVVLAFFQPIRFSVRPEHNQRAWAEELLRLYPSDIDDYFKLWPHDKHYYFDISHEAGLAYHVSRGVALVVGDPFGNPKHFLLLCQSFQELCFVNDWRPAFIHVSNRHLGLYEKLGYKLQKIGEEAVLDLHEFQAHRTDKYFRQIRNRFTKLGYTVEVREPPHAAVLLDQLAAISKHWLERPGRAERGFMMGAYAGSYMQQSRLAIVRDGAGTIRGFMNVVPAFEPGQANYDLLRCDADAPGNCNDFLLLGLIDQLYANGSTKLNLGLSPLTGLDETPEITSITDTALRFIYANGDRFYSFTGLHRFKAKYHPVWEGRYVAYAGGPAAFARIMTSLTRAMKIK